MRMTKRLKISRAIVLGFFFLAVAVFSAAQDKHAIERMNKRVEEWKKTEEPAFHGFELALPLSADEAQGTNNMGFVLVTSVGTEASRSHMEIAFLSIGGEEQPLKRL